MLGFLAVIPLLGSAAPSPPLHGRQAPSGQRRLPGSSFGASTLNLFNPSTNATFDYVVVGGGNAGIPVAVRLAEAGYSVALVEAGSFVELGNSNFSQVPAFAAAFSFPDPRNPATVAPMVDWNQMTTPQFPSRTTRLVPQGRVLGGSSARSHQAFHLGTKGSYQAWADAVGDQSYNFEHFSPYLYKPLNFTPPASSRFANTTPEYDPALASHTSGPVDLTWGAYAWGFASWAAKALAQAGIKMRPDGFTAGSLLGSAYQPWTFDATSFTGESSESTYLRKIGLKNKNLIVYPSTLAKRIIFDSLKTATGVEVDFGGVPLLLYGTKEVIVSAGALRSPQLLMVSGVGPAATLKQNNIGVVVALEGVGQNLKDHPLTGSISRRVNVETTARLQSDAAFAQSALNEYLSTPPQGPLTTFGSDLMAFEKLPSAYRKKLSNATQAALAKLPADWPEIEFLANSGFTGPLKGFIGSPDGSDWASIVVSLDAVFSTGNVTIASNDTRVNPLVNPGWLDDVRDQQVAIQAYRRVQELFNQSSLQPVLVGTESFPTASALQTDEQVLEVIRAATFSAYHFACTCKMGRSNDSMAVVDSKARVHGVKKLRVVDASILPILPPGHLSGTIYGLAEKIADNIVQGK
ncbi:GMC oxidoreductase [Myriangium duriaei CBS 260.36]|uniref:GMC oxidoreductase n=1 Tax=Myriangium duriaei CBS 260.36 TaxID=1168546 RepID=A0A9P4J5F9_9PEZI|nr:GMC oxidoreductase [Myriangium duriaei CBS 260.36]